MTNFITHQFSYLLIPIIRVFCKINTLGLQSITQMFGHQTLLQNFACLRINEVATRIDEEPKKRHRGVILVEEQVWMRAEGYNDKYCERSAKAEKVDT